MCEMCKRLRQGEDLSGSHTLVRDAELKGNEDRDFFLQMVKSKSHYRIENGSMVYDTSYEEPIYYLKAIHCEHDVEPHRGHHIAVEIKYCPFCGEKF